MSVTHTNKKYNQQNFGLKKVHDHNQILIGLHT